MIVPNFDRSCEEAELYYYDFLFGESRESIPEPIISHILQCKHCQDKLNQLKDTLSHPGGDSESVQTEAHAAVTTTLKLHFAYTGKSVGCEIARPFLPALLDPAITIRIPTPITTHIDNCRKCSDDFDRLRELNLNRKQLRRLSQLFAEKPGEDNISCSEAQAVILAVVCMAFHETTGKVLKHLCTCPNCRKSLYELRETFLNEYLEQEQRGEAGRKEFPCEEVSTSDIFDYVVPYGLNPADDQYAKFRESLTSHLRACPTCLAKMQQLHETVYGIIERPESQVVTRYHVEESAKAQVDSESEDIYSGFPIKVEVISPEDAAKLKEFDEIANRTTAPRHKAPTVSLKLLAKTGIAVAASILVAFGLFISSRTAKAVTIEQIYEALEGVKNVHIASFVPGKRASVQEIWVSKQLSIYMTKTGNELHLWNLSNKVVKVKQVDQTWVESTLLSDEMVVKMQERITGFWGLVPFATMSVVPENATWRRASHDELKNISKGTEVYDLAWTTKTYDGSNIFWKWRAFADPKADLPQRTELYKKSAGHSEYTLQVVKVINYIDELEIRAVLDKSF